LRDTDHYPIKFHTRTAGYLLAFQLAFKLLVITVLYLSAINLCICSSFDTASRCPGKHLHFLFVNNSMQQSPS